MKHSTWLFVAVMAAACSRPTPEMQIIEDSARAVGGKERVLAVKTLVVEGQGTNLSLGQHKTPEGEPPPYKVEAYKRTYDFANWRGRLDQVRTPDYISANTASQRQIQGTDGDVAFNIGRNDRATRTSARTAADRRVELRHHPIGILRASLEPGAVLSNPRQDGGEEFVDVKTAQGDTLTLAIDSASKLPTSVSSMSYDPNMGDVVIKTRFENYQQVGDFMLPVRITSSSDRYKVTDINLTRQTVDAEAGDLAAPADVRAAAVPPDVPPVNVTAEELSKGVWFLAGGSHNSVLVEFSDHLTLIEAPQNEARSLAVFAKVRELRPAKPLTEVIVTHHHFDHTGGLRAAIAEGYTIIAPEATEAHFQDLATRKHTIVADVLARNPKPLKFRGVDEPLILKDQAMTLEVYPVEGSAHTPNILMVYLPRERMLAEADLFTVNRDAAPFAPNLLENIEKRKLRVDRLLALHEAIIPFKDLVAKVKELKAASPPTP
jgi:glyoxylase-like metal-dependent hydrolase (beta-lactamase superfamily II)